MRTGLLAEFETPEAMLHGIRELRERGYRDLDAFTPYPVRGIEEALGLRRSPLNWYVLPCGLLGAGGAYLVQWYCNAVDYPIDVGGRPPHSAPAFIPITFEMGVLFSAVCGLVILMLLTHLPALYNPIFSATDFTRTTVDRFWIGIDDRDAAFSHAQAERDVEELGASRAVWVGRSEP